MSGQNTRKNVTKRTAGKEQTNEESTSWTPKGKKDISSGGVTTRNKEQSAFKEY